MTHGQDDEAAKKWEEFQNRQVGEEPQQKGVAALLQGAHGRNRAPEPDRISVSNWE